MKKPINIEKLLNLVNRIDKSTDISSELQDGVSAKIYDSKNVIINELDKILKKIESR